MSPRGFAVMRVPLTLQRSVHVLLLAVMAGVCLPALDAQSKDFARVIRVDGMVSVIRGGKVALFRSSTPGCSPTTCVNTAEEIVTGPDGYAVFQIQDGSTFEVFPNSHVIFRDTFNLEDLLNIILGKIRVSVEHSKGPNHKKVSTPTAIISVRGTIFDVAVEDDDGTTLVSVEEGEVEVRNTRQHGPTRVVNEGDEIRIYPNQPLAKAGGTSPGVRFAIDRILNAVVNIPLHGPGIGFPGGSGGGVPGNGDNGKNRKNPPNGAPPSTPPPPPGGQL